MVAIVTVASVAAGCVMEPTEANESIGATALAVDSGKRKWHCDVTCYRPVQTRIADYYVCAATEDEAEGKDTGSMAEVWDIAMKACEALEPTFVAQTYPYCYDTGIHCADALCPSGMAGCTSDGEPICSAGPLCATGFAYCSESGLPSCIGSGGAGGSGGASGNGGQAGSGAN